MNTPRILVIVGTPFAASLNHSLARSYADAARAGGAEVRVVDLANDTVPQHPSVRDDVRLPRTDADVPLTPEVAAYVADVDWADHLVFFFPQWWGSLPGRSRRGSTACSCADSPTATVRAGGCGTSCSPGAARAS